MEELTNEEVLEIYKLINDFIENLKSKSLKEEEK